LVLPKNVKGTVASALKAQAGRATEAPNTAPEPQSMTTAAATLAATAASAPMSAPQLKEAMTIGSGAKKARPIATIVFFANAAKRSRAPPPALIEIATRTVRDVCVLKCAIV